MTTDQILDAQDVQPVVSTEAAYQWHRFTCQACCTAGLQSEARRCTIGLELWRQYQEAPPVRAWQAQSKPYLAHHFTCHTCIAAGVGRGQRCNVGETLWQQYEDAFLASSEKLGVDA